MLAKTLTVLLCICVMCVFPMKSGRADVRVPKEPPPRAPALNELMLQAKPNPIGTCVDLTSEVFNERFLSSFRNLVETDLGISLNDYSTRPDLLTIEECNHIFVISTVNGVETSGSTLRFFFPVSNVTRSDFLLGKFGQFVFLMN